MINSLRRLCRPVLALLAVISAATAAEEAMAKPFVYISGGAPTITCFVFDPATGGLRPSSTSDGGKNPSYIAWNPKHTSMYAVNEGAEGRVVAFAIDAKDGSLKRINEASAGGKGPCHISVHPSGKWVFTANYGSGHVGVLPVREDGGVGEPGDIQLPGKNAHMALCDASGKFLFVPCLGSDHVAQFRFDDKTGKLSPNEPATAGTEKGAGPRHLFIAPNEKFAYLINELGSTMTSFAYDAAKGTLSSPETLPTLPAGAIMKGNSTAHVVSTPSGKFLYGSNRGNDTLVIYKIDAASGRLTLVGHENGGGEIKVPRDFTIDPSGNYLISASQKADLVLVFRIDPEKGTLTKLSTTKVPASPTFVGVMTR